MSTSDEGIFCLFSWLGNVRRILLFPTKVSSLEEKYGGGKGGKKKSKRARKGSPPDLDDEKFQRIQKQLEDGRSKR